MVIPQTARECMINPAFINYIERCLVSLFSVEANLYPKPRYLCAKTLREDILHAFDGIENPPRPVITNEHDPFAGQRGAIKAEWYTPVYQLEFTVYEDGWREVYFKHSETGEEIGLGSNDFEEKEQANALFMFYEIVKEHVSG